MTTTTETDEIDQEQAEQKLLGAVDNIADVQEHYDELTDEQQDMLRDSKSGIAAVYMNLNGEVVFDL